MGSAVRGEPVWKGAIIVLSHKNLVILAMFTVMFAASCRERPKPMRRINEMDGGLVFRAECDAPIDDCFQSCYHRDASVTCYDCCLDQSHLCDTQQPYSITYCDGAR